MGKASVSSGGSRNEQLQGQRLRRRALLVDSAPEYREDFDLDRRLRAPNSSKRCTACADKVLLL
jgi:hypothetical protein